MTELQSREPSSYRLYVVRFSDNRVKVGISADAPRRMLAYYREARRNNIDAVIWWASAEFADKSAVLLAERVMCRALKDGAINGQREWFHGDANDFRAVVDLCDQLRTAIGGETGEAAEALPYQGLSGYKFALAEAA